MVLNLMGNLLLDHLMLPRERPSHLSNPWATQKWLSRRSQVISLAPPGWHNPAARRLRSLCSGLMQRYFQFGGTKN
ncbi:rCG58395 [Rattus norvegicus]|uniref:RCG58395 n=1 Tax=Rattus norvegicus TaxID=10116 RepID=A6J5A1_RAT|nr:rCG58395 [Rattus norvegicus]